MLLMSTRCYHKSMKTNQSIRPFWQQNKWNTQPNTVFHFLFSKWLFHHDTQLVTDFQCFLRSRFLVHSVTRSHFYSCQKKLTWLCMVMYKKSPSTPNRSFNVRPLFLTTIFMCKIMAPNELLPLWSWRRFCAVAASSWSLYLQQNSFTIFNSNSNRSDGILLAVIALAYKVRVKK